MAVTSIWRVKGDLAKVMRYAENPEKTENLENVLSYAMKESKTTAKEETLFKERYVSGVNCFPATALMEMLEVKRRYGKEGGVVAYHGYQSFGPGEASPSMAHEIGVKLAESLWGGRYQVLVTTHLDKENHLHNHFVVNTVSYLDGLRYHRTTEDYRQMRKKSDELCREYGLSVVAEPKGRTKQYGEWRAEREGKATARSVVKSDVEDAIQKARTERQFFALLKERGYGIRIGKDITLYPPGWERGVRLVRNFGEDYTRESIRQRILSGSMVWKRREEREERPGAMRSGDSRKESGRALLRGNPQKRKRTGGFRGLYLFYCYQLKIASSGAFQPRSPPHFLIRADIRHMEKLSKEARLLCRCRLDTMEQVNGHRETLMQKAEETEKRRRQLRNLARRKGLPDQQEKFREEASALTSVLRGIRQEISLCDDILVRSEELRKKVSIIQSSKSQSRAPEHGKQERRDLEPKVW